MGFLGSLGSLFGLGAGFGANYLNGMMSTAFSKELQENQGAVNYKYARESALNSPTWNRQGLTSAGYNPMLAVQNATSGANSSWTSGNTMSPQDITSSAANMISNAQAKQRLENETKTAESTADVNYANADKAKAEKALVVEQLPFVGKKAKADYIKTEMESAKLENDIHYQNEYLNYLDNSLKLQQRLGEMGIDVQKYSADKAYNASTYSANKAYQSSIYSADTSAETQRGIVSTKLPFGFGFTHYDKRNSSVKPRVKNANDRKYWRNYY